MNHRIIGITFGFLGRHREAPQRYRRFYGADPVCQPDEQTDLRANFCLRRPTGRDSRGAVYLSG